MQVRDREIKVNIFDMAGHPFFYEVRQTWVRAARHRAALSQPISEAFSTHQLSSDVPEIGFGGGKLESTFLRSFLCYNALRSFLPLTPNAGQRWKPLLPLCQW